MKLINIEDLGFEVFDFGDDNNHKFINYISEEDLLKAPRVELVKHARWVVNTRLDSDGKMAIRNVCSHCGYLDHVDFVPADLWEMGYKNAYKPELHAYCAKCGYKMDDVEEDK